MKTEIEEREDQTERERDLERRLWRIQALLLEALVWSSMHASGRVHELIEAALSEEAKKK